MAGKVYEVGFRLAGQLSANFSKSFKNASGAVKNFSNDLNVLNSRAAKINGVVKLRKEVGESARDYTQAKLKVAELGKQIASTNAPTKKLVAEFEQAKKAVEKAKTALDKKKNSLTELEAKTGTAGQSLQELVNKQKALEKSANRARVAQQKLADITERQQKVADAQGKVKSAAGFGNAALLAGGAAVGAGAGAFVKFGTDISANLNMLQAQTGATNKQMQDLTKSALDLYNSGFGENFAEITNSLATMKQATGLAGAELKNTTKDALTLGKAFGFDINESARTSAALIKNFGVTGKEAFDLIAYASQNGANKNGDILDTFNEYSVHYKALGFSAEQFTKHLIEGAKSGAWSIDKVGDMMKEFTIRSKDASTKSLEAFETLGLSGEDMTAMFAKGGDTAQEAFFKVVESLNAMEDPVEKNTVGVALFGTMFEDLEADSLNAMLSLKNASLDTAGAIDKMANLQKADLGSQINLIARHFQSVLAPSAMKAAQAINNNMPAIKASINGIKPAVQALAQTFISNIPAIMNAINGAIKSAVYFAQTIMNNWSWIAPLLAILVKGFLAFKVIAYITNLALGLYRAWLLMRKAVVLLQSSMVGQMATMIAQKTAMIVTRAATLAWSAAVKAVTAVQWLWNAALSANPIGAVIALIVALVAAGVAIYKNWDKIVAAAKNLWEKIKSYFGSIGSFITGVWDKVKGVWDKITGFFGSGNKQVEINENVNHSLQRVSGQQVPGLASGGIATAPTLAYIGEGRESEAVLPLSKLDSMLSGTGSSGSIAVTFSPTINISGGGTDAYTQVERGLNAGAKNLKRELEQLLRDKHRLSYA